MQKIVPHLWFDKEAKDAAEFYTSIFEDSKINNISKIKDTPSGDCDIVSFQIQDFNFMAISAGPYFKLNPSISFFYSCQTEDEVVSLYTKLSEDAEILMPLDKYDFSDKYCWIQDKFGVSWQLILTKAEGDKRPKIVPSLLFVGNNAGKAEEAMDFYLSLFKNSEKGNIYRYGEGQEPDREGSVMFEDFRIEDLWITAMDSAHDHKFGFNEAVSMIINCKDQNEIDYFWNKLSAYPEAEQCGWIKDRFGVSWQIVPENMDDLMARNPEKTTPLMLSMKKIIISDLEKAGIEK